MRFAIIDPEDGRWTSFLARSDHDVYHRPGYVRLVGLERGMRPCACYGVSKTAEFLLPLLLSPVPEGLGLEADLQDGFSPDGYPCPLFLGNQRSLAPALRGLMSFLREERIVTCFIRSHPVLGVAPDAFLGLADVIERGHTVPIQLDASYEEIIRRMRQGHRYEIRKARDRGFRVVVDEWNLLPHFVRLYRRLMKKVDADPAYRFSDAYFERFRAAVGDTAHIAFALNAEGIATAGALFTCTCGVIQYHLAATDSTFEKAAMQKLVIDELIRWGIKQEARVIHLGGGVGARDDSLLRFKAGFSPTTALYHTIHLVPDPDAEQRARDAWCKLYGDTARTEGFFPVHRLPAPVGD